MLTRQFLVTNPFSRPELPSNFEQMATIISSLILFQEETVFELSPQACTIIHTKALQNKYLTGNDTLNKQAKH